MEVRAVSVSKLELTEHSVLYDVGAGTGSISVECAGLSDSVKVFAIEKNPEAVELLEQNFRKFALTNAKIIAGNAPEALNDLPAPNARLHRREQRKDGGSHCALSQEES